MTSDAQLEAFIDKHKRLLAQERTAEVERSSLLVSNCGPKLLELKGLALGGLGVAEIGVGLGGKTLVELERPSAYHSSPAFPPHTFRPGDLARIEENVVTSGPGKKTKKAGSVEDKTRSEEGVVYKVSETRIVVAVNPSDNQNEIELPERCRVLKLANNVTYDRMEKALENLEQMVLPKKDDKPGLEASQLTRVLLGISSPTGKNSLNDLKFFDETLNDSQKEAVKFVLESPEAACIHGPPGTGKTHTLVEVIRQLTTVSSSNPKSQRVLVCGASNLSVDNILERLLALPEGPKGERLKVTRIGHPARVMSQENVLDSTLEVKAGRTEQAALAKDVKSELETALGILSGKGKGVKGKGPRGIERKRMWEEVKALRKEYRQREGGVVKAVLSESQVVVSTCHSSGGWQMRNQHFDVVIIDEATQALEAVCWIPIFKGKKLILAGDPKQLPPTILSIGDKPSDRASKVVKKNPEFKDDAPKLNSTTLKPTDGVLDTESESSSSEAEEVAKHVPAKQKQKRPRSILRPPRTLETTLFDRLEKMYGPTVKRMLNVQYRMHEQICSFPSKTLYSSKLNSHESVASRLLRDLPETRSESEEDEKEVLSTPVVFFDTAGCEYFERLDGDTDEGSRCNENEASVVKMWIEKLTANGVLASQIAIITPYQAQVTLLTSLLRPTLGPDLEIGTVDGMQGREKDAVIISLVRSNDKREVGFLKEKRRLNVAMTRAKRHLCVIGDSSTVQHGSPYLKKWITWLENNADNVDHQEHATLVYNGVRLSEVFDECMRIANETPVTTAKVFSMDQKELHH